MGNHPAVTCVPDRSLFQGGRAFACSGRPPGTPKTRRMDAMSWTAPKIDEVSCGMEINMYFPADDGDELF